MSVKRNVKIVETWTANGFVVLCEMVTRSGLTEEGHYIWLFPDEARLLAQSLLANVERIEQRK